MRKKEIKKKLFVCLFVFSTTICLVCYNLEGWVSELGGGSL